MLIRTALIASGGRRRAITALREQSGSRARLSGSRRACASCDWREAARCDCGKAQVTIAVIPPKPEDRRDESERD